MNAPRMRATTQVPTRPSGRRGGRHPGFVPWGAPAEVSLILRRLMCMRVTVKLFAGLRERAGWSEREIDDVVRVGDVWGVLQLGDEPRGLLYAVNREYADRGDELADGDEVRSDQAGAIATFLGTTRIESRGRTVLHLDYDAYEEMAQDVMTEIADELKRRYDVCEIAIHHRTCRVEIGTASVVIAVSAPHRQEAIAACKDAIDTLKERVPLWKKEIYEGGEEWIGRGS